MNEAWLETLSSEECLRLLRENVVGRIAFLVDAVPAVFPVNYRLVESHGTTPGTWVAVRTRPGNVIDRASTSVAFEIDGIDPTHQRGWSVLVRGELHHIDGKAVRKRFDPDTWLVAERDAWVVIEPFQITGRRLHPDTPEWAFDSRAYL
jgi:nitroimidazol reductase NimA-like FMN-containing flavoprotein (pyridoxamine 5'-phosphate oxidase superfamily)